MAPSFYSRSGRLVYRQTIVNDLETILSIENDSQNISYIIPWSHKQHLNTFSDQDKLHIVVEEQDQNKIIGYIILAGLNNPHENVEIVRIVISKKGNGFGKEALNTIIKYIFEDKKAHRVWLDVKEYNERAKQIYLSLGFKQEGILRECIKNGDEYESLILMSMLKQEYSKFKEG